MSAADSLLGCNPMDVSYVTGYGTHAVMYPHHRYWAGQIAEAFPTAPAGVLVGGPNSGMQDPWVKGSGWKKGEIAPAKCYMDHIEAWSVNECTINWNAPLAWLTGFLCDSNGGIVVSASSGAMEQQEQDADTGDQADANTSANTKTQKHTNPEKETDTAAASGFPVKLVIILGASLLGLIIVEVFVYQMVKLKKK